MALNCLQLKAKTFGFFYRLHRALTSKICSRVITSFFDSLPIPFQSPTPKTPTTPRRRTTLSTTSSCKILLLSILLLCAVHCFPRDTASRQIDGEHGQLSAQVSNPFTFFHIFCFAVRMGTVTEDYIRGEWIQYGRSSHITTQHQWTLYALLNLEQITRLQAHLDQKLAELRHEERSLRVSSF